MESPTSNSASNPIRLALRGAGGLLGHRLLRTILATQPDMAVPYVILGPDTESFRRFEGAMRGLRHPKEIEVFVDATRDRLRTLAQEWNSPWPLQRQDQAFGKLMKMDAIVDAAIVPGKDGLKNFYDDFSRSKPIVFQSGTYPQHHLASPPFGPMPLAEGPYTYRQGDCLLSGVGPLIFPFRERIRKLDLHLLVQRQKRLNDYTLRDNLDDLIVTPGLEDRVKREVHELLPHLDESCVEASVFEVPGHDYYLCEVKVRLAEPLTEEDFLETLRGQPRVTVLPPTIEISTGQVQQLIREPLIENGRRLKPILVFSCPGAVRIRDNQLLFRAAFYSKAITMLPNIDTVRSVVRGMTPLEAMRQTDAYYFTPPPAHPPCASWPRTPSLE